MTVLFHETSRSEQGLSRMSTLLSCDRRGRVKICSTVDILKVAIPFGKKMSSRSVAVGASDTRNGGAINWKHLDTSKGRDLKGGFG